MGGDERLARSISKRISLLHDRAAVIRTRVRLGTAEPTDDDDLHMLLNLIDHYEAAEVLEREIAMTAAARLPRKDA
jgi:hypothetical protein